jgi:hypothetical protein
MTTLKIEEIDTGSAYAAKFVNEMEQTRIGVLVKRDLEQQMVQLIDSETGIAYVRRFDEIWDIDHAVPATEEN